MSNKKIITSGVLLTTLLSIEKKTINLTKEHTILESAIKCSNKSKK